MGAAAAKSRWGKRSRLVSTCLFFTHNARLVLGTDGWRRLGRGGMGQLAGAERERGGSEDRRQMLRGGVAEKAGAEDRVPGC